MRSYKPDPAPGSRDPAGHKALEPFAYERIYAAWWASVVPGDGKAAVARSADRYLRAIAAA